MWAYVTFKDHKYLTKTIYKLGLKNIKSMQCIAGLVAAGVLEGGGITTQG